MKQTSANPGKARSANGIAAALLSTFLTFACPLALAQGGIRYDEVLSAVVSVESKIPQSARTAQALGTERSGSGVVIDADGLIVTIGYLILEASEVAITLTDGQQVPVRILGYDHNTGFGLLRAAQGLDVTPLELGRSSELEESDQVLVIGFGGPEAVRPAVVLARRPFAGYWEYLLEDAIFTSPPHPSFSGAALVGPAGELLGIGSLIVSDALPGGEKRLSGNMFVPIDRLETILGDMLATGRSSAPPRPWLGVFTEEVRGYLFITRIAEDSPAARAGLKVGEIIVGIGDSRVSSMEDFYRRLWASGDAGVEVPITVLRDAKLENVTVQTGNRYDWLRLNPSF